MTYPKEKLRPLVLIFLLLAMLPASLLAFWPLELPFQYLVWLKALSDPGLYSQHISFPADSFDNTGIQFTKLLSFANRFFSLQTIALALFIFCMIAGALFLYKIEGSLSQGKSHLAFLAFFSLFWFFDLSLTGFWYLNQVRFAIMHYCLGIPLILLAIYLFLKGKTLAPLILWAMMIVFNKSVFLLAAPVPIYLFFSCARQKKLSAFWIFLPPFLILALYFLLFPYHPAKVPEGAFWYKAMMAGAFSRYGSFKEWPPGTVLATAVAILAVLQIGFIVGFRHGKNDPAKKMFFLLLISVLLFYGYYLAHDIFGLPHFLYLQIGKVIWFVSLAGYVLLPVFLTRYASGPTVILTPLFLFLSTRIMLNNYPRELLFFEEYTVVFAIYAAVVLFNDLFRVRYRAALNILCYLSLAGFCAAVYKLTPLFYFVLITLALLFVNEFTSMKWKSKVPATVAFSLLMGLFAFLVFVPGITNRYKTGYPGALDKIQQYREFKNVCENLNHIQGEGAVLLPFYDEALVIYYLNSSRPAIPFIYPTSLLICGYDPNFPEKVKQMHLDFYGEEYFDDLDEEKLKETDKLLRKRRSQAYKGLTAEKIYALRDKYHLRFVIRHLQNPIVDPEKILRYKVLYINKPFVLFEILDPGP